jgi:hypothetical protein
MLGLAKRARPVACLGLHHRPACACPQVGRIISNSSWRPAKSGVRLSSPLGWQPSRFLTDRAEADRNHRLADQRASRPDRRHPDRADRTSRSQQPQERATVADAR